MPDREVAIRRSGEHQEATIRRNARKRDTTTHGATVIDSVHTSAETERLYIEVDSTQVVLHRLKIFWHTLYGMSGTKIEPLTVGREVRKSLECRRREQHRVYQYLFLKNIIQHYVRLAVIHLYPIRVVTMKLLAGLIHRKSHRTDATKDKPATLRVGHLLISPFPVCHCLSGKFLRGLPSCGTTSSAACDSRKYGSSYSYAG